MSALRLITLGLLVLTLTGCGQLVSERLGMSGNAAQEKCTSKKIVILPIADYTYAEDAARAFQRQIAIMENVTANLTGKGFRLPVQEDVVKYLADNSIITLGTDVAEAGAMPGYVQNAINNDASWSAEMKAALSEIVDAEQAMSANKTKNTYALDSEALANVANAFGADLVMRGQLIKYEFGEENTWNPMKKGLFPVVFGGTNRALFGVTNSETYDTLGYMLLGGGLGAAIGDNVDYPYDETEKINPGRHNSVILGIGGAAVGYMASKGGHANRVAVQLRLWVQDPQTTEVIWTNSVKVMVKPQTVYAETRKDELFDTAVSQAVAALADDFVNSARSEL